MAKPREVEGLTADMPLREAAGRIAAVRAAEIFEHSHGVLDTNDIEGVHDMRVATRRLRGVLEVFEDCFPAEELEPALAEVKALADALGARRDPDVALDAIETIARKLAKVTRPGIDAFEDELRADQGAGNEQLQRALADVADARLEERLTELAESAVDDGSATFAEHAATMRDARRERLRKRGDRALRTGRPDHLHKTRIAAKRLRYLYELTEPIFGKDAKRGAKEARALQDLLGELHDCDVLSERLRDRAAQTPIADDRYVGLEALASYMDAKRRVLHRQYMDTWTESRL
jgi:CHAD domain-containing protein